MALSDAIVTIMRAKNITRAQLMERLPNQASKWAVYRLITGDSKDPRNSTLTAVCAALEVEPNRLMQLAGFYDGADRHDLLHTARLHAILSVAEGFDGVTKQLAVEQIEAIVRTLEANQHRSQRRKKAAS